MRFLFVITILFLLHSIVVAETPQEKEKRTWLIKLAKREKKEALAAEKQYKNFSFSGTYSCIAECKFTKYDSKVFKGIFRVSEMPNNSG